MMIPKTLAGRIMDYGRMIKFSHTVFALPFALSALVLVQRFHSLTVRHVGFILLAMVCARSAAMGVNRLADARFDAANPRTAGREIPSGKLSPVAAFGFVAVFSALFVGAAAMLGSLCLRLSFPVLAVLFFYSFTKRFTWAAHLWLGFAISLAPIGAWIAVAGGLDPAILPLSVALMTYIAGFDILYACQDAEFDRSMGLFSIPAQFGVARALRVARLLHVLSFGAFLSLYFLFAMTGAYLATVAVIGVLLVVEHRLVHPEDLSRIDIAFFHVNSLISLVLFAGILADECLRRLA